MLDTSTLITALRSGSGAAAEIVRIILAGKLVLLMDYKLAMEYREVANRPEHLSASRRSSGEVEMVIEALEAIAEPVMVTVKPRPLSLDPNDDMVLDLAINGRADTIVTQNIRHFGVAARYSIAVLGPGELLEAMRQEERP